MKYLVTSVLLIGVLFTGFGQHAMSSKWKTQSTKEFSVQYPPQWEYDDSGLMGTNFIIFSPQENSSDQFRENVNYSTQDVSQYNMTLDQFVELTEQQLFQMITDAKLISSERISHHNKEMHRIEYAGKQGQFSLTFYQLFWIENGIAHVLTFTAEEDQYEKYSSTARKIIKEFTQL